MKFYYDLHLHSCLSPCGSDEMTPGRPGSHVRSGGAGYRGPHRPQYLRKLRRLLPGGSGAGPAGFGGDGAVHPGGYPCGRLFPDPEHAERFSAYVSEHLAPFFQRFRSFGRQLYMDGEDNILGEEERMLAASTDISVEEVPALAAEYGGFAFPAHIDRPSFSLLGVLGLWDSSLNFPLAELSHSCPGGFYPPPRSGGPALCYQF